MKTTLSVLFLTCIVAKAATITATTAAEADVQTAYNSAVDGDIVVIPDGRPFWTNQFNIAKAITLQSANGPSATVIQSCVPEFGQLFVITCVSNKHTRFTGIGITNGTTAPLYSQYMNLYGVNTDARDLRIDHCFFYGLTRGLLLLDSVVGSYDHNAMISPSQGVPAPLGYVKGSSSYATPGIDNFGDAAMAMGSRFGTTNAFFFEDNTFTNLYSNHLTLLDSQNGSAYVFRYNLMVGGFSLESHGSEAQRERGMVWIEVYGNVFRGQNTQNFIGYWRGGSGLVYSNYVSDYGVSPTLQLINNRLSDELFSPFGGADGRNPWDSNNPANPLITGTCSSAGAYTMTDSGKSWTTDQWAGYTLRRTSGKSVSSLTRSGSTITVTAAAHGFTNGQPVALFGANQQQYNQIYTITVANANSFTAAIAWTPTTPATGTIFACAGNHFSEITGNTTNTLTFKPSLYQGFPVVYDMGFTAGDTYEINEIIHAMDQPGWSGGTSLAGVSDPTLPVGWNNQTNSMWREWQNVKTTVSPATYGAAGTLIHIVPTPKRTIVAGRDFTNAVFNYTQQGYPHYLVNGGAPTDPGNGGGGSGPSNPATPPIEGLKDVRTGL